MLQNAMVVGSEAEWDARCDDSQAAEQREALAVEMQRALTDADAFQAACDEADAQDGEGAKHLAALLFATTAEARWEALRTLAARITTAAGVVAVASRASTYSEIGMDEVSSVLTAAELNTAASTLAHRFGLCAELSRAN